MKQQELLPTPQCGTPVQKSSEKRCGWDDLGCATLPAQTLGTPRGWGRSRQVLPVAV